MAETTVGLSAPTLTISAPNTDGANTPISNLDISAAVDGHVGGSGGREHHVLDVRAGALPSTTTCPTGWTQLGAAVAVSGDGTYNPSTGFTPTLPGDYWWYAAYSGDTDNAGTNSGCGVEETVVQPGESLSVAAPSASGLGSSIEATATLSGPNTGGPGGTISFWVYQSTAGAPPTSCPATTVPGWTQVGGRGQRCR